MRTYPPELLIANNNLYEAATIPTLFLPSKVTEKDRYLHSFLRILINLKQ